jgi:hypothetical protein
MSKLKEPLLEMFQKYNLDKVRDSGDVGSGRDKFEDEKEEDSIPHPNNISEGHGAASNEDLNMMASNVDMPNEGEGTAVVIVGEDTPKKCDWVGWTIRICIILGLVGLALWIIFDRDRLTGVFKDFIDWLQDNPILAPFVLTIVYIFATIFFIPGLILTLGAGFAFNEAYGNVGSK